jgi:hypothetical protein
MANPTLNWRFVGTQTFTAGSLNGALDALYTLGTKATFNDGTTRTPGTGSAWTWAREQTSGTTVACYGNPPTNALGMRYIIAGSASAVSYTLLAPDTATATGLLVAAMQKNAGTYTTWGSATPFTNAGFSGYWRTTRAFATIAYDSVSLMESQEGCVVQFAQASTGSTSITAFGALFDPIGSGTAQSETDGRVYSLITAGANAVTSGSWASITTDGSAFGQHVASVNTSHAGYFQPRTNTIRTSMRFGSFTAIGATFVTADAEPVGVPLTIRDVVTSNFVGAARQWYLVKDQFSRVTVLSGATTIGYTVAATINTTAGNAVMVRY